MRNTIRLLCVPKPNERVERERRVPDPRGTVVPKPRTVSSRNREDGLTHQLRVPPMNSGRENVGLATTAPRNEMSKKR